jgi:phage shock protein A
VGIFSRMTDIINSNLNSLLDTAEDPKKMIRLIIQEMEDTLVEVRSSSARVLADRKTASRRVQRLHDEMQEWENKAKLAISKGREDLAKAALLEKQIIGDEVNVVEHELSSLDEHIEQLHEEVAQLQLKLSDAKAKQQSMQLRGKTVESRIKVKRQMQREVLDDAFAKFERFERRIDNLEGQVEAMDLGSQAKPVDLASEIDALVEDEKVNEELARLKAQMSDSEKVQ